MRRKLLSALSVVWLVACLASTGLETGLLGPYPATVEECHPGVDRQGEPTLTVVLSYDYVGPSGVVHARTTVLVPYGTREYLILRSNGCVLVWVDSKGYIRKINP